MATKRLGIIMHGVTGRMGYNQHLVRSICAIRDAGRRRACERRPRDARSDPGRPQRGEARRDRRSGTASRATTTDLDAALANTDDTVFFDAGSTQMRADLLSKAIDAGKDVYCEKPIADTLADAIKVAKLARSRGIKNGVVQDKLFLPGLRKMKLLKDAGFFGRMLSVRGEFGYWVFEGDLQPIQRPSWNYRKADGGGIILDMLCHWRYVLDNLFGEVKAVSCLGVTHIPRAHRRSGQALHGRCRRCRLCDVRARGRRDRADQLVLVRAREARRSRHLPGRRHARLGGRRPHALLHPASREHAASGLESGRAADDELQRAVGGSAGHQAYDNGFKLQWEDFIRHVVRGSALDVRSARKASRACSSPSSGCKSWAERRWLDVPDLSKELVAMTDDQPAGRRRHARSPTTVRNEPLSRSSTSRCDNGAVRRFNRIAYAAAHVVADPLRRQRSVARHRDRLGADDRVPPLPVGPRPRRRRSDGHRPARHGARLARRAGADPPLARGREVAARRADRLRRRHRSSRRRRPA